MAQKRRLPIIGNAPASPTDEPAESARPPWHWVPLGTLVSIATGAVLSRTLYWPFVAWQSASVYGAGASPETIARIDATLPASVRAAFELKLALGGLLVAMAAVFVGGLVVGRYGANTNQRHGTLAGISTMVLLVLFVAKSSTFIHLLAYALLVPLGGVAGALGGRLGVRCRPQS